MEDNSTGEQNNVQQKLNTKKRKALWLLVFIFLIVLVALVYLNFENFDKEEEKPGSPKATFAHCFSNPKDDCICDPDVSEDCISKNTRVVGTFDMEKYRLTDATWGEKQLKVLRMKKNENRREGIYDEIHDGQKVAFRGLMTMEDSQLVFIGGMSYDLQPDSMECDDTFACFVKDYSCTMDQCAKHENTINKACINNKCGCKCASYTTN